MSERRKRRTFSEAFKAEAVRLVRDEGKSVAAAARALDLAESALRLWVRDAEREARHTGAMSNGERKELEQLRRENRTLRMERDILKQARRLNYSNVSLSAGCGFSRAPRSLSQPRPSNRFCWRGIARGRPRFSRL